MSGSSQAGRARRHVAAAHDEGGLAGITGSPSSSSRARYFSAAHRHIHAWVGGELRDRESGLPHLAHAVCCLLLLAWFDARRGHGKAR